MQKPKSLDFIDFNDLARADATNFGIQRFLESGMCRYKNSIDFKNFNDLACAEIKSLDFNNFNDLACAEAKIFRF